MPQENNRKKSRHRGKKGPRANAIRAVRRFRGFGSVAFPEWMRDSRMEIQVEAVSAIFYSCPSQWAIKPRKIADDALFFIVSGRGIAEIGGERFVLRRGVCANLLRGGSHAAWHDPKDPISVISIHYTATVFKSLTLPELFGFPPTLDLSKDKIVEVRLRQACRIYATRPVGWRSGLQAETLGILLHLIWNYGKNFHPQTIAGGAAELQRLAPSLAYMRDHLHAAPGIGSLARRSNLSEPQFRRVFRRVLGTSPIKYLRRLRIERACHLLKTTDLTLEAIAGQIGYTEAAYFATVFRAAIGIPPGAYRKQVLP